MVGPETGVRQETTKKNDHGLQLGDVVWARTMDGSLFWPASVARTSKGNLRLWKTGRFVHVKFFAPDKLDIPFNERWVAPCSGDVAPFEPQLLAGVAFEDAKLQESAYKAALHFYENQQTLSVVRRHLDAVACSTRTGGSASSTASAIRRRPPFARRPAAPQPIPSAPADRKSAWGPLSAMSNGRGHENGALAAVNTDGTGNSKDAKASEKKSLNGWSWMMLGGAPRQTPKTDPLAAAETEIVGDVWTATGLSSPVKEPPVGNGTHSMNPLLELLRTGDSENEVGGGGHDDDGEEFEVSPSAPPPKEGSRFYSLFNHLRGGKRKLDESTEPGVNDDDDDRQLSTVADDDDDDEDSGTNENRNGNSGTGPGGTPGPPPTKKNCRRTSFVRKQYAKPGPEAFTADILASLPKRGCDKRKPATEEEKALASICHQCRQNTMDQKSVCRSSSDCGSKGSICAICLRRTYGENLSEVLLDPKWTCPFCRDICLCSLCMRKKGCKPLGNTSKERGKVSAVAYIKTKKGKSSIQSLSS